MKIRSPTDTGREIRTQNSHHYDYDNQDQSPPLQRPATMTTTTTTTAAHMSGEVEVDVTCEVDDRRFIINICREVDVDGVVVSQLIHHLYTQCSWVSLVTIDTFQSQQQTTAVINVALPRFLTRNTSSLPSPSPSLSSYFSSSSSLSSSSSSSSSSN